MKETGIIMSGNHPKLVLNGIKTMTRRVIKPQPELTIEGKLSTSKEVINKFVEHFLPKCPYGQVGDRLWVRETWSAMGIFDELPPRELHIESPIWYSDTCGDEPTNCGDDKGKTRPSIHMPRWASRIDRIITLLRVERLRDISEADAIAEGGYTIEEFIKVYLKINHLPEDADPWNWVIGW